MMEYLPLQKFYYKQSISERVVATELEAKRRLTDESSFRTSIEIEAGELFLAMPRQLSVLNDRLLRIERKVLLLWHELPGIAQWAYLRGLIMDEIVSTNAIEGVHSSRRQIEQALTSIESKESSKEYRRFKEFARLYLELTNKNHLHPKTPNDIREIYDAVVAGELSENQQPDGDLFRKEAVDVITTSQKVIHSGVLPESRIIIMLEQMISLMGYSEMPPTFAAIITHFLFEYIHPFYDGNGRTGRYLLARYLSEPLSLATVLSLSSIISEHKNSYYKAFAEAEALVNHGEMTFFVIQMMKFIRLAQDSVMDNLERKKELLTRAEKSLDRFSEAPYFLSSKERKLMFHAVQHTLFDAFEEISLEAIARHSGVSMQTARKYTIELEKKGLLEPVSLKPLKFKLTPESLRLFDIHEG